MELFAAAWNMPPALAAEPAVGEVHITEAVYRAGDALAEVQVPLPDTWALRGLPAGGTGHYRLRFTLPAAVHSVWAVDAKRLSTPHEVRLNGQLVHGALEPPRSSARCSG